MWVVGVILMVVVARTINVKRLVVGFSIWLIGVVANVEGYVKEACAFMVCHRCDF